MSNVLKPKKKLSKKETVSKITGSFTKCLCDAALDWLELNQIDLTDKQKKLALTSVVGEFKSIMEQFTESDLITMEELRNEANIIVSAPECCREMVAIQHVNAVLPIIISCINEREKARR